MSMLEEFFSLKYADRGDLFEGLSIWKEEKYRELQGTYPVIALSFANVKETGIDATKQRIFQLIKNLYSEYSFLADSEKLTGIDKDFKKNRNRYG